MSTMSLAVVVDLEDAYSRVQFKLQHGVSLMPTRWLTAVLRERKVSMRLGNWISTPQQLTLILPKAPPPPPLSRSPVLYNVCTKGLANLNSNGLSWVLTLADDRLIYKTATDSHTAVNAIQEQLKKCPLSAKSPKSIQAIPVVHSQQQSSRKSNVISLLQWRSHKTQSQIRGIQFDRMLTSKTQVESTKLRCKKGLSAPIAMLSKGVEQCHMFLLYQSVILSVIDYGLGLTTLSQSNHLKLD